MFGSKNLPFILFVHSSTAHDSCRNLPNFYSLPLSVLILEKEENWSTRRKNLEAQERSTTRSLSHKVQSPDVVSVACATKSSPKLQNKEVKSKNIYYFCNFDYGREQLLTTSNVVVQHSGIKIIRWLYWSWDTLKNLRLDQNKLHPVLHRIIKIHPHLRKV